MTNHEQKYCHNKKKSKKEDINIIEEVIHDKLFIVKGSNNKCNRNKVIID